MEPMFIEAKFGGKIKINKKDIAQLPDKIGIASTVQFIGQINNIKSQFKGKKIFIGKGKQKYKGQILGCDVSSAKQIKDDVQAFLYIGTGYFHPIMLGLLDKDVFILNPIEGRIIKLNKEIIESYKKRKKERCLNSWQEKTLEFCYQQSKAKPTT